MILIKDDPIVIAWSKRIVRQVRHRAKKKGLRCTLKAEDLLDKWTGRCPVFGTPLRFTKLFSASSPSLDQIKPRRGYTRSNVVILSYRANTIKNNATPQQLRRLASWLERLEWQRKGADLLS